MTTLKNIITKTLTVTVGAYSTEEHKEKFEIDLETKKVKLIIAIQELRGLWQSVKSDNNGDYITRDRKKYYFKNSEEIFS